MTCEEFSNEFDTLLNSYRDTKDFGQTKSNVSLELDEYEKSIALTQAQEDLISEFYTGKNVTRDSFEKSEEIRRSLNELVKTIVSTKVLPEDVEAPANTPIGLSTTSQFFALPTDVWFITFEIAKLTDNAVGSLVNNKIVIVKPVTQDEYYQFSKNPFKKPNAYKVFRLDIQGSLVELISDYQISTYTLRYVTQPSPIILEDLGALSINNISTKTECILNPVLHREILKRAINIALQRYAVSGTSK